MVAAGSWTSDPTSPLFDYLFNVSFWRAVPYDPARPWQEADGTWCKIEHQCFLDLPRTFGLANLIRVTTSDKVHAPAVAGESGERPDFQPGEQGLHQE